jgi:hypothetical protein
MKNIHVLPTEKPSRLFDFMTALVLLKKASPNDSGTNQNIYITSSEKIEEVDWCLSKLNEVVRFGKKFTSSLYKKIILTTDQDLIKDGVQAIDDEFLEWFVNNPSCEWVEVEKSNLLNTSRTYLGVDKYKIIIPQEKPKPKCVTGCKHFSCGEVKHHKDCFYYRLQEAAEKMYSEEEVENIITKLMHEVHTGDICYGNNVIDFKISPRKWFKQFKNK